jgi:hypothetical protein
MKMESHCYSALAGHTASDTLRTRISFKWHWNFSFDFTPYDFNFSELNAGDHFVLLKKDAIQNGVQRKKLLNSIKQKSFICCLLILSYFTFIVSERFAIWNAFSHQ